MELATPRFAEPCEANGFLAEHVCRLDRSLQRLTGRRLVDTGYPPPDQAKRLFHAPFAVVSHDAADDPVFNYGNRTALALWDMSWSAFTTLPSRKSAEPLEREARAHLLARVATDGFIDDYQGIRISRQGRRFVIRNAIVWNLLDEKQQLCGQAAMFADWENVP